MTLEQDMFAPDGRKPRTKEELEEMLKSPEFRAEMTDSFAQIERGEYSNKLLAESTPIEPLSLEEARSLRGTGWEGDLDEMRSSRVL